MSRMSIFTLVMAPDMVAFMALRFPMGWVGVTLTQTGDGIMAGVILIIITADMVHGIIPGTAHAVIVTDTTTGTRHSTHPATIIMVPGNQHTGHTLVEPAPIREVPRLTPIVHTIVMKRAA